MNELFFAVLAVVCIGVLGGLFIRVTKGTRFANHAP